MPRECLEYMDELYKENPKHGYSLAYADSVVPLVDRGLVDVFKSSDRVLDCLQAEPAAAMVAVSTT